MGRMPSPRYLFGCPLAAAVCLLALLTAMPVASSAATGRSGADDPRDRWVPVARLGGTPYRARFVMVGFTGLTDAGRVRFRTHGRAGWSDWVRAERLPGSRASEPVWTGRSDAIRVRAAGVTTGLRVVLLAAEPAAISAGAHRFSPSPPGSTRRAARPRLRTRRDWGADPRWRSGRPRYNRTVKQVHIHHTASPNGYRRRDVAPMIRSFYRYHTRYLGWSDIGYNFLVDRFGRAWVGRAGGAAKPVRGAHTLGFNHNSVGIAVIGNFQAKARPRRVVLKSLARVIAWKLDKYHRHPRRWTWVWSEGSDRFRRGRRVHLPVIDGHRDTNFTSCPGWRVYRRLPKIREFAQRRIRRYHRAWRRR